MLTEHHTGAIAMATTEQANGQSTDAIDVAQRIITTRQAEIAEMKALLNTP